MRQSLELDLLQTLVAIADSGSFAAAAGRVHRTQSAVSMQMRRLELIAGKPLFDRDGRRARLTPTGETLLAYARRILNLQDEAFSLLDEGEIAGTARLGIDEVYADPLLPLILTHFARNHPRVEVMLRCEPSAVLRDLIMSNDLDMALVSKKSAAWLDVETLRHEPLVWVAAPTFDHTASPLPLALPEPGCPTRDHALKALARSGLAHRVAYSSPNFSGVLTPVRAGLAVTVIAQFSAPQDLRVLEERHGFPRLPNIEIGLLRAQNRGKPADALAECITGNIEPPVWWPEPRHRAAPLPVFMDATCNPED
ncbi:LysR substrate-binding domain-containing protein [Nitrospirillum sp. BR 11828]|uniref:LysR substrate-binding domain-containing protein n=1 Tax=Nitrospirillum sp. BR 11828 TaxID=3104325 RepID=UPI002ACACC98|nr:LysR substrate-binding domain-containing protein [Nitrospirillum sp. BR 11828]MDZ5649870.1 LysR substrate-binding domain-containing protein [Nitrospirillum sp. BR 11828]